jgi:hypothetical protein
MRVSYFTTCATSPAFLILLYWIKTTNYGPPHYAFCSVLSGRDVLLIIDLSNTFSLTVNVWVLHPNKKQAKLCINLGIFKLSLSSWLQFWYNILYLYVIFYLYYIFKEFTICHFIMILSSSQVTICQHLDIISAPTWRPVSLQTSN